MIPWSPEPSSRLTGVTPFLYWMQVLILLLVVVSSVIAIVKL
jgi:hypothetical protein